MFIFLKNEHTNILKSINEIYDLPKVEATSGIGDFSTNTLKLWVKENIMLHYRKINDNSVKLLIQQQNVDDDMYSISYK